MLESAASADATPLEQRSSVDAPVLSWRLVRLADPCLVASIARPLLPDEPVLLAEERVQVEQAVVDFVWAQIGSMPIFLRIPYEVALLVFDWLALACYGRRYRGLDHSRQQAYVRGWSGSRLRLARDLVKLVRSCALLQYLDHPLVLARLEADHGGLRSDG